MIQETKTKMTKAAVIIALALSACAAGSPTQSTVLSNLVERPILPACPVTPSVLAPPVGYEAYAEMNAQGVVTYTCLSDGAWSAGTFGAALGGNFRTLATAFGGPAWLEADGSQIQGTRTASITVTSTDLPWQLFGVTAHLGPFGVFTEAQFVQLLSTSGGRVPAAACTLGTQVNVPFVAGYWFYHVAVTGGSGVRCGI